MMNRCSYLKHNYPILIFICLLGSIILGCKHTESHEELNSPNNTSLSQDEALTELSIDSLNRKSIREWELGNYQKAMDYIMVAYEKARKNEDDEKLAFILNTMGLIHWRLDNPEDAMLSYESAAALASKLQMTRLLGLTHTNRGLIHKNENETALAFFHNNKAIELFKANGDHRDLAIALNNQGQIFKNQNINDSALHYYEEALKNYQLVDYKDGASATYYNLSEIYMRQNLKNASLEAAHKSLNLGLNIESRVRISEAYMRLSDTYEYFNQPDSALKYLKLHNTHHHSMLLANQSSTLAKYQAEMGAEVKLLKIQNLQKERALANNRMWFIGIGVFIALLISGFFVYRFLSKLKYKRRNLERMLSNSKKILTIKEQELKSYILDLSKKNALIGKLQEELSQTVVAEASTNGSVSQLLEQKILTDDDWSTFKNRFDQIYPGFFLKMKQASPELTEAEVRFMVLLRLRLTGKEMANLLGISPQSVRVCKLRLKKKLLKAGYTQVEDYLTDLIS